MAKQIALLMSKDLKIHCTSKRKHIFNWLRENKYMFLQELHCINSDSKQWEIEWGSQLYISGNIIAQTVLA